MLGLTRFPFEIRRNPRLHSLFMQLGTMSPNGAGHRDGRFGFGNSHRRLINVCVLGALG
jgi:hypothetical protein